MTVLAQLLYSNFLYESTRHLLYKHKTCYNSFYSFIIPPTSWGQFCLFGICAYRDTKLSINISFTLQHLRQVQYFFHFYEGFSHSRAILPSVFKTSPVLIATLLVQSRINVIFITYQIFFTPLITASFNNLRIFQKKYPISNSNLFYTVKRLQRK